MRFVCLNFENIPNFFCFFVQAGVDMAAELLGVTLGPKGRNVVLQNKYGPPKIVNDGETVLKQVLLHKKSGTGEEIVGWALEVTKF